jgi:hypothetical protein
MTFDHTSIQTLQTLVNAGKARHPELTSRIERALVVLLFRELERLPGGAWLIAGERADSAYTVAAGGTDCTCPDAAHRAPYGLCKHRLAVRLLARAEAIETAAVLVHFAPEPALAAD